MEEKLSQGRWVWLFENGRFIGREWCCENSELGSQPTKSSESSETLPKAS